MSVKILRRLPILLSIAISVVLTSCNTSEPLTPAEQQRLADQELENRTKEYNDYMSSLAGVDLDPAKVTLGDLRKLMREQGSQGAVVRAVTLDWGPTGSVEASFVEPLSDASKPYYLAIRVLMPNSRVSSFRGSLRGFKIGDPVSKLVSYGRGRGYAPDMAHHKILLDSKWYVIWGDKEGNLESIAVCRQGYSDLFGRQMGSPPLD